VQEQNRAFARDIPHKLARAGYVMRPARSNEPPGTLDEAAIETLAELEHERWLRAKLQAGWRYAPRRDRSGKLHDALLPWQPLTAEEQTRLAPAEPAARDAHELPEAARSRVRDLVRGIPRILARIGYSILPSDGRPGES